MKEVFTSPFTTATTCYSVPCDRSLHTLRFANETHVLGVSLATETSTSTSPPTTTSTTPSPTSTCNRPIVSTQTHGLIPRDSPSLICIGYSQVPVDDSPTPIQAYALVDPLWLDKQQDTPQPLHRPDRNPAAPVPPAPDDVSMVSMVSSLPSHDISSVVSNTVIPRATLRNNSSSGEVSNSTGIDKDLTVLVPPSIHTSTHNAAATTTSDADAAAGPTPLPPKARLLLQIPPLPTSSSSSSSSSDPPPQGRHHHGNFVAQLDFRPLSPCVLYVEQSVYLVVGSAEDSQLYCYQPKYTTDTVQNPLPFAQEQPTGMLERITLSDPSLVTMYTPIMGLEFHRSPAPWEHCYTLALTTQEGSIRIIQWQGEKRSASTEDGDDDRKVVESSTPLFHQATVHDILADGPLLRLHFQDLPDGGLRLVLGSLYGYVFSMTQPTATSSWEDPDMIVSGLWKDALQSEDPVLAVYAWKETIWVGTLGGRCLVYQRGILGHKYYLSWECTLPYSIHGFGVLLSSSKESSPANDASSTTYMAVITRRTLHVLQLSLSMDSNQQQPPRYSLAAAQKRVKELLKMATAEPTPPTPIHVQADDDMVKDLAPAMEGDEEGESSTTSLLQPTEEVASPPATATKPTTDSGEDTDDELVDYESWILFPKWPSQRSSQRSKEGK